MDERVDSWVGKIVADHPGRIAVTEPGRAVTYDGLGAGAEQVRSLLEGARVEPGGLVGVRMPRGWRTYAAVLGIWQHGCGYVPVDPSYPQARQDFVLADAGVRAVVAATDDGGFILNTSSAVQTAAPDVPAGTAYVIHTSGSTGRPKGVVVSHASLAAFLKGFVASFGLGPDEVWAQSTSPCFDVSLAESWAPLVTGARLLAVPETALRDPRRLAALLAEEDATVLSQVPTVFRYLLDAAERTGAAFPELRRVLLAGEPVEPAVVARWSALGLSPKAQYHNLYGPTEGTVYATCQELTPRVLAQQDAPGTPIGTALPHVDVELFADGQVVPDGEIGEIHLARGIAEGYLGRPDLTSRVFLRCANGTVWYRTGDLAVREGDGTLRYLGRADRQVKVRGMRVELGEIESRLQQCAGVAAGAVVMVPSRRGEPILVACFAPRETDGGPDVAGRLPGELAAFLPAHMVPVKFLELSGMPLTLSGKLDRTRLEEIARKHRAGRFEVPAAGG
ncbi:amino acid adenylation domain-containing protein [Streptomyces sp. NBC_01637]|uniref:amino acid adenylation domain-containing protein n=1 Tax=unclassified Streptomyces TaxID=2593676 RepID=UPI00386EAC80|nr:amino acid adenylation domain-containing protein [Streptomyces sp. NBC_01653]WTC84597.1 amino acid adenylation domain-containing protein [Streptomyces sp. NBC_01653]WTD86270.1 amino acid adenylation domain-containing protein [Streptomyces sp. NBC_01637]WTD94254.1 amino acid adenylation domain-containing protein [Streptomyces sp. NBC_01637]